MTPRGPAALCALAVVLATAACTGAASPPATPRTTAPPSPMSSAQLPRSQACTDALQSLVAATGSAGIAAGSHTSMLTLNGGDSTTGVTCFDALSLPSGETGQTTRYAAVTEAYLQPKTAAVNETTLLASFHALCRAGRDNLPNPLDGLDTPLRDGLSVYEWPQTGTPAHQPRCYFYRSPNLLLHVKVTVLYPEPVHPSPQDLLKATASADAYATKMVDVAKLAG